MKSYIQDTPDLLRYFEEINNNKSLPQGAKPFALDIKSMYCNIPTNEGINAFKESLNTRYKEEQNRYPTDFIMKLLKIVLEGNIRREFTYVATISLDHICAEDEEDQVF